MYWALEIKGRFIEIDAKTETLKFKKFYPKISQHKNRSLWLRRISNLKVRRDKQTKLLANSNGGGMKAKLAPSVTGGVGSTASKMQLCQEEEFVRHGAIRMCDGNCFGAPVHTHTYFLVD